MPMMTTIKVTTEVRDRIAVLASRHGRPLGAELAALVSAAEEREWWRASEAAAARLAADPQAWSDYVAEAEEWDAAAGDALTDAAGEWPEFNAETGA